MKEGTLWTEKGREKFFVDKNTCILFYQWWCTVKSLRSKMRQIHAKTRWSKLSIINVCIGKKSQNKVTVSTPVSFGCVVAKCLTLSPALAQSCCSASILGFNFVKIYIWTVSLCKPTISLSAADIVVVILCQTWLAIPAYLGYSQTSSLFCCYCHASTELPLFRKDRLWINPFWKRSRLKLTFERKLQIKGVKIGRAHVWTPVTL